MSGTNTPSGLPGRVEQTFEAIEEMLTSGRLAEAAALITHNGEMLQSAAPAERGEDPAGALARRRAWRERIDRLLIRCDSRRVDLEGQLRALRASRRFESVGTGSRDRAWLDRRA